MYIISDTHLKANEEIKFPVEGGDFIHLGDYGVMSSNRNRFKYIVFGNHDFWGYELSKIPARRFMHKQYNAIVHTNWYSGYYLHSNVSTKNRDYQEILTVRGKSVLYANRVFEQYSQAQSMILREEIEKIKTRKQIYLFLHVPVLKTTSFDDPTDCWFYDEYTYDVLRSYDQIRFNVFTGHVHRLTHKTLGNVTQITLANNKWMEIL